MFNLHEVDLDEDIFSSDSEGPLAKRIFTLLKKFFSRAEGHVFLLGLFLTGITIAMVISLWIRDPSTVPKVWAQFTTELFLGREAGIPAGIGSGLDPFVVFFLSSMQDIITVCLVFPLVWIVMLHWRSRDNWFGRALDKVETAAEQGRGMVDKYKAFGLYLFMLIPFMVNGPLIGAFLGKGMKVRTWSIMASVICAQLTAAAAWTFAWDQVTTALGSINRWMSYATVGGVILTIAIIAIVGKIREMKRERASHEEETDTLPCGEDLTLKRGDAEEQ